MTSSGACPFDLRLPVCAAPLFLISGPELVLAACGAGIIGALPTANARPIEVLEAWMATIADGVAQLKARQVPGTVGPWCANVMTHRSNTRLDEELDLIAKYRPPMVVTALGSPRSTIEIVHGYGGIVFADVPDIRLARKAVDAGVDGLACLCAGAGGHTGFLSPFAFVSELRKFFDGYISVGGGIGTGWGVAGAIACGADLAYVGTSFIATRESLAAQAYKQMVVDSTIDDLVVSASVTGTHASWLKPSLLAAGLDPDNLPPPPARNYDTNQPLSKRRWKDIWSAGQGIGRVRAIETVADVVARLDLEYREATARMTQFHREETQHVQP